MELLFYDYFLYCLFHSVISSQDNHRIGMFYMLVYFAWRIYFKTVKECVAFLNACSGNDSHFCVDPFLFCFLESLWRIQI